MSYKVKAKLSKEAKEAGIGLPIYQTAGSAGMDLCSIVSTVIQPGESKLIPTGLSIELPSRCEAQIRPRSGLALKHSITVLNTPGTIDSDYRGEIGVVLINHGKEPFHISVGVRIAQMVVSQYEKVTLLEVTELSDTTRGAGGYGSTGTDNKQESQ